MAELSYRRRKQLPKSAFAVPSKDGYPVTDRAHARAALQMSHGARSGKPASAAVHAAVHRKVGAKFPEMLAEHMRSAHGKKGRMAEGRRTGRA